MISTILAFGVAGVVSANLLQTILGGCFFGGHWTWTQSDTLGEILTRCLTLTAISSEAVFLFGVAY